MIRVLLFALLFAMPAAADDVFMNNTTSESNMCVIGITGQTTSNPAAVARATYSPITYTCAAGTYLPADGIECVACPGGKYCEGGQYSYNETTAQGLTPCPAGYTSSATGSSSQSDCYRACTTSDVAHATSVTGNVYSNGTTTCAPANTSACETGYSYVSVHNSTSAYCTPSVYNINYVLNGGHILPSGYTQVEYIQSSGTQYIDTEITASNNGYKYDVTFIPRDATSTVIGNQFEDFFTYTQADGWIVLWVKYGGTLRIPIKTLTQNVAHTMSVGYDGNTVVATLDNIAAASYDNGTINPSHTVFLFANHTPNAKSNTDLYDMGTVAIKSARIWNNGSLVRDFIPARRNSDDELGMYDMVSGNFFTNDGTGTFTAGPDTTTMPTNTYTYGTGLTENIVPIRAHGSFVGWCDDAALTSNCTTPKTISTTATGDKTFYAKYLCDTGYSTNVSNTACTPNTITIDWSGYGAGNNQTQSTQCTYGGSITTPTEAPTKRGHVFVGWTFDLGN